MPLRLSRSPAFGFAIRGLQAEEGGMLSSRGRLLTILGGTLLLALLSSIVGFSRPIARQPQSIKPSPTPPLYLSRRAIAVGLALCAAIAAAIFIGRWYQQMEDKRQAAIALTGGNP